ncbi:uncharacterized protein LOC119769571 isoform X1 [Culex quinquefasciatus]|uniref:uncharacterized protein LOC119769571 isoform X1 n=2 Tax=Culex quinquefasciatus TaxID=7176 RepID=UPI0018E2CAD8|nr:uncharacterized protein LOC119769571 isoform X1 [Culex quinquefasciatus]
MDSTVKLNFYQINMSQKSSTTVQKPSRPKTVAARRRQPSPARKSTSQESLQLQPAHKLGHIPEYLRKARKLTAEGDDGQNVSRDKCHHLEEENARLKQTCDAQQQLIRSLQERVAQLDAVVLEIKPELARLCGEIEARERKIQSMERTLVDGNATRLDRLCEEVQGLRQLVQQPAEVFQHYGRQLNGTMDMLARSYYELLSMVETRRINGQDEYPDRNFDRQKMRLDKRSKHTQIRVKKYDG